MGLKEALEPRRIKRLESWDVFKIDFEDKTIVDITVNLEESHRQQLFDDWKAISWALGYCPSGANLSKLQERSSYGLNASPSEIMDRLFQEAKELKKQGTI